MKRVGRTDGEVPATDGEERRRMTLKRKVPPNMTITMRQPAVIVNRIVMLSPGAVKKVTRRTNSATKAPIRTVLASKTTANRTITMLQPHIVPTIILLVPIAFKRS